jgi:hypothetical protein
MNGEVWQEAWRHAGVATPVALIVALACAALIGWASSINGDATIRDMRDRCMEAIVGGAVEALLVALIMTGMSSR